MKHKLIKSICLILLMTLLSCHSKDQSRQSEEAISPKGELGSATNFTAMPTTLAWYQTIPSIIRWLAVYILKKAHDRTGTYILEGKLLLSWMARDIISWKDSLGKP